MRIKKTTQTTTTQAQIVDGYSTSKIDGYSCDYLNNNQTNAKVLWTNPNPTSNFQAQTITLSSNDYDMLEVIYYDWNNNPDYGFNQQSIKITKGANGVLTNEIYNGTNALYHGRRMMRYISDTSYSFSDSLETVTGVSNPEVLQGHNIPVYIIGYKTELFD